MLVLKTIDFDWLLSVSGYIDHHEFRDLCASFDINPHDADIIFADLDHDGDNRISFEDFSFGFRDFLTPGLIKKMHRKIFFIIMWKLILGVRRGSAQLGLSRQPSFRMKKNGTMSGTYPGPNPLLMVHMKALWSWKQNKKKWKKDTHKQDLHGNTLQKIWDKMI